MKTKCGCAWKKKTADGKTFLSCQVNEGIAIQGHFALFPVESKKNVQSPDFELVIGSSDKPKIDAKPVKIEDL